MPDLEAQLTALGQAIDWPATPRFGVRLPLPAQRGGLGRGRWALAAAAALLIVATLLAYTPTREAIAGWLNLHTTFIRTEHPPTPTPRPSVDRLGLGTSTTLAAAQGQVGWKITLPASLGAPDQVYLNLPPRGPSGGEVTLVYSKGTVLVTEARGAVNEQFFVKILGPGVKIEPVSFGGRSGYWISGQPHGIVFVDANGNPRFETLRLAGNTLIFDDGGTVVRIEGDMTKQQAIDIGRSLT